MKPRPLFDAHRLLKGTKGLERFTPEPKPERLVRPITTPILIAQADTRYSPQGTDHLETPTWRSFWLSPKEYRLPKHVALFRLSVVVSGQDDLGVAGVVGIARIPANASTERHTFQRSVTAFDSTIRPKSESGKFVLSSADVYQFTLGIPEPPKGTGSIWAQLHVVDAYPEAEAGTMDEF